MANIFKNFPAKNIGTVATAVYTVPAATTTTLVGMSVANTSAADVTVDVMLSISGVDYYIVKGATVVKGGALIPVGGDQKLVMTTGNIIKVVSSAAGSVDAIISGLEIT